MRLAVVLPFVALAGMLACSGKPAPVQPGETITLQFLIWDTGDGVCDSSAIIDNWQWQASDTSVTTHPVN